MAAPSLAAAGIPRLQAGGGCQNRAPVHAATASFAPATMTTPGTAWAPPPGLAAAAVWPGEDLEQVTVGILEVQAAAAVTVIDDAALASAGIRPVGQALVAGAAEGRVQLRGP